MFNPFHNINIYDEDQSNTVFRYVTLLALSGFVAIVLLLLPWLNLKTKKNLRSFYVIKHAIQLIY